MFVNHLKIAFRHIVRYKWYSATNMVGMTLALTACLLLSVLINHELSFDQFHHYGDRLCILAHKETLQTGEQVNDKECAPFAPALKSDLTGITTYVRTLTPDINLTRENQTIHEEILCADHEFFQVFSFPLIQGDSTTALSDPKSIVLSERAAKKWFGDSAAVGKTLVLENAIPLTVTGVMKNIPSNSTINTDYVVPFLLLKEAGLNIDEWAGMDYGTYLLIDENVPIHALELSIDSRGHEIITQVSGKDRETLTWFLQPLSQLHLHGLAGQGGHFLTVKILISVAVLILLIACVNFVNISTAQSMSRAKEVGLRKTVGAQRTNLIFQFVGEAGLQIVLALLAALALTELLLPSFSRLIGAEISWHLGLLSTVPLLLTAVVVVSVLAALYPAVHFSAHRPSIILRSGGLKHRGVTLQRVLVIGQFTLSIVLTVGSIIIARQMNYIATRDLGFSRNDLYGFAAPAGVQQQFDSFRHELLKDPNIKDVSYALQNIANISSSLGPKVDWDGKDPNLQLEMHMEWVSYDYAQTLGISMAHGRFYSREHPADATDGIVLNERAVALMGLSDPIGKRFSYWGKDKQIIGVTKDFFFQPLRESLKPMVLIFSKAGSLVYVRVTGDNVAQTLAHIESVVKSFDPAAPISIISFEEGNQRNYAIEYRVQAISRLAVAFSIIIACIGLFGLSAFAVQQRTRELGVRKVLGASQAGLLTLLSRESILLVAISCAIAYPGAYFLAKSFLQQYAYHTSIGIAPFGVASLLAFAAAAAAVSYHALKASRVNPVESLRYE